jgi:hypothetical protein
MARISLIGAGNIKFHYFELLKLKEEDFDKQIREIAKVLADSGNEIVLLPDKGAPFEIAKKYKEFKGKKVIGTVPCSDTDFGIKHLQQYINAEMNNQKVFDEIIDTNNWYKQDLTCCIYGDVILMLGNSLGSFGELVYGYYLYKLFIGDKPEVRALREKIHKEVRAGRDFPFTTIIYMPFMKEKLNLEIEAYIKKLKGIIYYPQNIKELKEILGKLPK